MSHPDEGMIHAWLDGELDAAEAARVEALVRDDPAWGAAAAEARGLIAASARIIGALDHVPANVVPKVRGADRRAAAAPPSRGAASTRRALPWWAARVAAVLVVATGTVVVFSRSTPQPASIAAGPTAPAAAAVPEARPADSVADKLAEAPKVGADAAKAKDVASVGGRAGVAPAPSAPLNEPNAKARASLNDARVEGKFAAAELVRRDSAGALKQTSTDEKRLAAADQAAAQLKKEADLGALAGAAKTLPSAVTAAPPASASRGAGAAGVASALATAEAASPRPQAINAISREECYREAAGAPGGAPVIHRVGRTGDTTAVSAAALGLRSEADAIRARQAPTAARSIAPNQAANEFASTMRVRGDTLFVRIANGTTRVALRITCPAP